MKRVNSGTRRHFSLWLKVAKVPCKARNRSPQLEILISNDRATLGSSPFVWKHRSQPKMFQLVIALWTTGDFFSLFIDWAKGSPSFNPMEFFSLFVFLVATEHHNWAIPKSEWCRHQLTGSLENRRKYGWGLCIWSLDCHGSVPLLCQCQSLGDHVGSW